VRIVSLKPLIVDELINNEKFENKWVKILIDEWLYQVRIKVSEELSNVLRAGKLEGTSKEIYRIASKYGTFPVCTYDAFCDYCAEAESNVFEEYPLYDWTKKVIEDPEKRKKHIKSFAFYTEDSQVYKEKLARSLLNSLLPLHEKSLIEDLTLIDSNPKNNPQPPRKF